MEFRNAKSVVISTIALFGTLWALSIGYGAYVSNYPATASSGTALSSSEWNKMASAIQALDTNLSAFTINANGNVGIGTQNPDRKFEVAGQIEATQPVPGGASDGAIRIKWPTDSTYSVIQFTNNAGSSQWGIIAAAPSGKIGIGTTSPSWHLDVAASAPSWYSGISNYNSAPGGIRWTWLNGSTGSPLGAGRMCFESGGACRLNIDAAGNVTAGTFNGVSDSRLKTNVKTASGLDAIRKLRGVEFDWKSEDGKSSGVIAQELETVLPHLVTIDSSPEKMRSVNYAGLSAYFIEGMKELEDENRVLKNELEELKSRMAKIENGVR